MKILHLVTQDYGGAGRAAYRIFTGIRELGHDVKMLVLNKNSNDPDVRVLCEFQTEGQYTNSPDKQYISPRYQQVWREWFDLMNSYPRRPKGLEIFTDTRSFTKFVNSPEVQEADILNFHWMAGYINFDEIARLLPDKPIVWTLHDMNPFTGGCHYAGDCLKYKNNCGACPQLGSIDENDISRKVWEIKDHAYSHLNINVLTPSKWLGRCAKESSLFGRFPVHVIANGFPLDKYFPKNRESLRDNLNIPLDQKVILFGADNILNERKGLKYFLHALSQIVVKRKDIALAFFGHFHEDFKIPFEVPIYQFGTVADEMKLSAIYSLADVFVIPSLEDNLPNTVVESMASGTPVVGFNIGGIPDMVENGVTGQTAKAKDVDDLASAITKVIDAKNYYEMRDNCLQKAQNEYSLTGQATKYVDLYEKILSEKPGLKKKKAPVNVNIGVDKEKLPVISIVTPSFNQKDYLEECIDSILSQNYPHLEYVIMDGGSTDGSMGVIKKYEKYLKYWKSEKDNGQYAAINEGFNHTTGDVMTWLNSDDLLYPRTLHAIGSLFGRREDVNWVTGRPSIISGNEMSMLDFVRWTRKELFDLNSGFIQQEGTFWRRTLWEQAGGNVSEKYKLASDFELWARFFRYSRLHSIVNLNAGFRKHEGQKSERYFDEYLKETSRIIIAEKVFEQFNDTPPVAVVVDENLYIPKGDTTELAEYIKSFKSEFQNGNYKKAAGYINKSLYCDVNNKDLAGILVNLYKAAGENINEKVSLWNLLFASPLQKEHYEKLLIIERAEKKLDNIAVLLQLIDYYEIDLTLDDNFRESVNYYRDILRNIQYMKLSLENRDEQNASKYFNNLTNLLSTRYQFEKDMDFTMEEVIEFAQKISVFIEAADYTNSMKIISEFFSIEIKLVL